MGDCSWPRPVVLALYATMTAVDPNQPPEHGEHRVIKLKFPDKKETKVKPFVSAIAIAFGGAAGVILAVVALTN